MSIARRALIAGLTLCVTAGAIAIATPAVAQGSAGALTQLKGSNGCVTDRSESARRCTAVRALRGPGPFLGSNAAAISPDGRYLYVASAKSNAIAVLKRNRKTGTLRQRDSRAGCISEGGTGRCAGAVGLGHPNSVVVSPDGANVYATADASDAVTVFARNPATGGLTQATDGTGCVANAETSGCTTGRALDGADVVTVSPDGANVYVGAFFGNAVAVFTRDPSTGALAQPAGATGCVADTPTDGCSTALALAAPEGMAISGDGANVYVASAVDNAALIFTRDPSTGALSQATDGSGCIVNAALADCTTGTQLAGANAVAVSPDGGDVYVTSLISNSLTSFARTPSTGQLTQQAGTSACVIDVLAVGCSLGREFSAPEGLAVSPDGANVYAAAFESDAVGVLNRDTSSGAVIQKSGRRGCVTTGKKPDCGRGRALNQVSSLAVSPDGRYVYSAAFASDAIAVFKRKGDRR